MHRRISLGLALLVGVIAATPRDAAAQGFGIYEQGACNMAMAGAAVADPCKDGSAVFFNPAALADLEDSVFTVGATVVAPFGNFTPFEGTKTDLTAKYIGIPNIYYAQSLGSRAKFGLGVNAPYGLEIEWPLSFEGRFLAYNAELQAVYIQPTLAFKLSDQVMVGGGIDISRARVQLQQRVDLSTQRIAGTPFTFAQLGVPPLTDFADIGLEGDNIQFGYHLGLLVKPNDRAAFGVRYLSRQKIETDEGTFSTEQIATGLRTPFPLPGVPAGTPLDLLLAPQFAPGAALEDGQRVATSISLPDQFVAGVMFKPSDKTKLKVDYQFTNWSVFDVLVIEAENGLVQTSYEDYKSTHALRIGTEVMASDKTAFRAGFLTHTAAAPDQTVTPLLPEGPRWEFTLGLGRNLSDRISIDIAYQYLHQPDRDGRTSDCEEERPTAACNDGKYRFRGNLFGANLNFRW